MKTIFRLLPVTSVLFITFLPGCKKFIAINPPTTQLVTASVFKDNASATAAQLVIYAQIVANSESWQSSQNLGLLSDELTSYSTDPVQIQYYMNAMNATSNPGPWANAYNYIYQANAILEGLKDNGNVSLAVRQQLTGESQFIRAFWHFYLTNFYGDVPLVISTDYTTNQSIVRTSRKRIYQQIIADLDSAKNNLNTHYVDASDTLITTERVRPPSWAAAALLARTCLYIGNYAAAEAEATTVINNSGQFSLCSDLNAVFKANSTEVIWQLAVPLPAKYNTPDGFNFVLTTVPGAGLGNSTTISSRLLNAFEAGDQRALKWIGSYATTGTPVVNYYFPNKYKVYQDGPITEYVMVLRLAEQYLIRAEARAQQNKLTGAIDDLNVIRKRAGLANTTAATQSELLAAILHERQMELFSEWGHRWLDLIRTGRIDTVMNIVTPQKGGVWSHQKVLFPIPQSERNIDPNLTQNEGY